MITVSGPSEDWDQIAEATGDPSWRGERMRAYFQRVEKCQYNAPSRLRRFLARFGLRTGWEDARHGDGGWLETTWADLNLLVRDRRLLRVVFGAALGALENGVETFRQLFDLLFGGRSTPSLDPNHWETMRKGGEGLARIPCAVSPTGKRSDPRARLLGVKEHPLHGRRLHLLTGVCVTGLALNPDAPPAAVGGQSTTLRAVGVRCLPQENVYEAVAAPQPRTAQEVTLYCRRDVILCGGSFNTPQLLMLSGIGPKAHLERPEVGVTCVRDLPGVGENLQDRYEVPVVATVTRPFETLAGTGLTRAGRRRRPTGGRSSGSPRWPRTRPRSGRPRAWAPRRPTATPASTPPTAG
jgi:choline dehydrogenase